jgi:mRNA-degrading endonuclease RelE of RelBE toxin-antitoxin system
MKLSLTYSAYREMEQIARDPLRDISAAIVGLAEDPLPSGSATVAGQGGCHYLTIGRYCILYHIDQSDEAVTVLGVVEGPVHTLH